MTEHTVHLPETPRALVVYWAGVLAIDPLDVKAKHLLDAAFLQLQAQANFESQQENTK